MCRKVDIFASMTHTKHTYWVQQLFTIEDNRSKLWPILHGWAERIFRKLCVRVLTSLSIRELHTFSLLCLPLPWHAKKPSSIYIYLMMSYLNTWNDLDLHGILYVTISCLDVYLLNKLSKFLKESNHVDSPPKI